MKTIEKSVDVGVPASTAFGEWGRFTGFPPVMDGLQPGNEVSFEPVSDTTTRVSVHLEHQPHTLGEKIESALGLATLQVGVGLERFKAWVEPSAHDVLPPSTPMGELPLFPHYPGRPLL
ncbi:hypothetical protein D5S17_34665 [Pseudonocardiaceae bacterium YIM PH 21723]|nr:hypothetical protein D5S17_34665 [Pseudonocardiaceae bacterium YIM PH 21723]